MLFVLYRTGIAMKKRYKVFSVAGMSAIFVYTLNEGLRFGRGIDYNLYARDYEYLASSGDANWDFTFQFIAEILISMGIPWQGYIMLMSFIFIVATLFFLKPYKEVIPFALPLFVYISIFDVENMVRWFMGYSFIMIGISSYLNTGDSYKRYWLFGLLACSIHLALLPLVLVFFFALLFLRFKPISPIPALIMYIAIGTLFNTEYMTEYVDIVQTLTAIMGDDNRFSHYGDKAEYWLTGGFAGTDVHNAFPGMFRILYYCVLILLGHAAIKHDNKNGVFVYNMTVVGLLTNPISLQLELAARYAMTFFFFRAIMLAYIIRNVFILRSVKVSRIISLISLLLILNQGRRIIISPFYQNPDKMLYVWNRGNLSYQKMYDMWIDDMYKVDSDKSKRQKK